jgi:hypothetical protein
MLEKSSGPLRSRMELIAMCFPTPRDPITDRAKTLFDGHINLFPANRYISPLFLVLLVIVCLTACMPVKIETKHLVEFATRS